jgi:ribosomal protein S18 acetylase RimI-like enzyme
MPKRHPQTGSDPVEIHLGLPKPYRRQAAALYYEAFLEKWAFVLPKREEGIATLERALVPKMHLIALHHGDLVGAAGIEYGGKPCIRFRAIDFTRQYGWLRGTIKWLLVRLFFTGQQKKGQLTIESLAVQPAMRGQGIGTKLVETAFDHARDQGLHAVRLEVVNTNRDARRLYERLGFVAAETHYSPYLRPLMGFSAWTEMVREL